MALTMANMPRSSDWPIFSRVHYDRIALTLRHSIELAEKEYETKAQRQGVIVFMNELIKVFRKDNAKFNEFKFIEAVLGTKKE